MERASTRNCTFCWSGCPGRETYLFGDLNPEPLESHHFTRMICQKVNAGESKIGKDLCAQSRRVLNGLVSLGRQKARLIAAVNQKLMIAVAPRGLDAGPGLVQVEENATIRLCNCR